MKKKKKKTKIITEKRKESKKNKNQFQVFTLPYLNFNSMEWILIRQSAGKVVNKLLKQTQKRNANVKMQKKLTQIPTYLASAKWVRFFDLSEEKLGEIRPNAPNGLKTGPPSLTLGLTYETFVLLHW